MSDWRKCDGLPEEAAKAGRIDVCYSDPVDGKCTAPYCLYEQVISKNTVEWWRPTPAATDAAHPAAESPREVSDGHPDDARTSPAPEHSVASTDGLEHVVVDSLTSGAVVLGDYVREIPGYDELGGDDTGKVADSFIGVQETLNARGARYGDFTDNAAVSQRIKDAMMYDEAMWAKLNYVQREALTMIAQKIARILNGDPNYKDNWHDIQGYARLAEERCRD